MDTNRIFIYFEYLSFYHILALHCKMHKGNNLQPVGRYKISHNAIINDVKDN